MEGYKGRTHQQGYELFLYIFINFYWNIVAVQCCVGFYC